MPALVYFFICLLLFGGPLFYIVRYFGKTARRCKFCRRIYRKHQVCMNTRDSRYGWCKEE